MLTEDWTVQLYSKIGELVQRHRQVARLTQQQLASATGLSRASIANLEAGRQRIQIHILYDVAQVLDVPVSDLLPWSDAEWERQRLSLDQGHVSPEDYQWLVGILSKRPRQVPDQRTEAA